MPLDTSRVVRGCREDAAEVARGLAMHAVAAQPLFLSEDAAPEDVVAKERLMVEGSLTDSEKSKPEHVRGKILEGRLRGCEALRRSGA